MKCFVSTEKPQGFSSTIDCAACYCEWQDKILLVKRHPNSSQGLTWGLPAGKMEKNETPRQAVIREVREEVGLEVDDETLESFGLLYCRLPHVDFHFHVFRFRFHQLPAVQLSPSELIDMKWLTHEEALKLPLIAGGKEALDYYKQRRILNGSSTN